MCIRDSYKATAEDYSAFEIYQGAELAGNVEWSLIGAHNASNALAAILLAKHAGVPIAQAATSLATFKGIKRRLEMRGDINGVCVYDDFAHHPTAITTTLKGLRARVKDQRIIVVFEPRSNTMQMGVHKKTLGPSFDQADEVFVYESASLGWDLAGMETRGNLRAAQSIEELVSSVSSIARAQDHIVVMSNGGFGGLHDKLLDALATNRESEI